MTDLLSTAHRRTATGIPISFLIAVLLASCLENQTDENYAGEFSHVGTVAGSGDPGFVDGTGSAAMFNFPCGMVVDAEGNVYVADNGNHTIRKITPGGVVSTFAGSGKQGKADGFRLEARFNQPYGLALDHEGNLYVGDVGNHRIRVISSDGMVSTLAGRAKGFADSVGAKARFYHPYGVAVDAAKNVYVADSHNHRIRKIHPDGSVTTLAGNGNDGYVDGSVDEAEFYVPIGIAVDRHGNVYVGDEGNSSIRKITPDGRVMTLAGNGKFSFADGVGQEATFNAPGGIAIDTAGNLFVADYFNNCVRRVTPGGAVRKIAGNLEKGFADGEPGEAEFFYPFGIALDAHGTIYVGDQYNHRVRKIN